MRTMSPPSRAELWVCPSFFSTDLNFQVTLQYYKMYFSEFWKKNMHWSQCRIIAYGKQPEWIVRLSYSLHERTLQDCCFQTSRSFPVLILFHKINCTNSNNGCWFHLFITGRWRLCEPELHSACRRLDAPTSGHPFCSRQILWPYPPTEHQTSPEWCLIIFF